ncbi:ATP diphosphatase [Desulfonatronum thiosulfatophilum]|uniref:ATP diphosphatase n=1 Tax=Desulfonatronum thiosulfatophilum TaxID=617002 RepID=A0A1G6ECN2_9BACT|nr:nucleoside triphosphate pyrophosphohydrolase [Desulfonatronum thiosulfatophilum]SDB55239.1 ATP diphosphatase [Desulfonatronum thiosulfatophilum]
MNTDHIALQRLRDVLERLLGPGGCPWDRDQTPQTLADYLVEEVHELVDAIRSHNTEEMREELGDVWFLLLFVTTWMERRGRFTLSEVLDQSAAKMIRRHPHVFADAEFANLEALWANWEKEKKKEKADRGPFEGIPTALPPLLRAYRIHSKAARLGFTWQDEEGVREQLDQEWREWHCAENPSADGADDEADTALDEYGDYLFTLVEYGRRKGLKANEALDRANRKFLRRFEQLASLAEGRGIDLEELDLDAWNALWNEVKKNGPDKG